MNKFKKLIAAVSLGAAVAAVPVATEVVEALPSSCSTAWEGYTAATTCWSGSGKYRVVAQTGWGSAAQFYYGPCRDIGFPSRVYTPRTVVYAYKSNCL